MSTKTSENKSTSSAPEALALRLQSAVADNWGSNLREAFLAINRNHDGRIDRQEFEALLARQNLNNFPAETKALLDLADQNGDGTLDFAEFLALIEKAEKKQSSISEAQDGFQKPASNYYVREAQIQAERKAREYAATTRWASSRNAFAGKNTASSLSLGVSSSSSSPSSYAVKTSKLQQGRFAGANSSSSVVFGDDGIVGQNLNQSMTAAAAAAVADAVAGKNNTPIKTSVHQTTSSSIDKDISPFDPANFVKHERSFIQNVKEDADHAVARQHQLLRNKKYAGRAVSSSIQFTSDGILSQSAVEGQPFSHLRMTKDKSFLQSSVFAVNHDHTDNEVHRRQNDSPAAFLSRVKAANATAVAGSSTASRNRVHRGLSPPKSRDMVESSLKFYDGSLISTKDKSPIRSLRTVSSSTPQHTTFEISQTPGHVPYRQQRRIGAAEIVNRPGCSNAQDPGAFLSHVNKGNIAEQRKQVLVDPAAVPVSAGSTYVPILRNKTELRAHYNFDNKAYRFAGRRQKSTVSLGEEAANKARTNERLSSKQSHHPSQSSLTFG